MQRNSTGMTNTIKILIVVAIVVIIAAAAAAIVLTQDDDNTTKVPGAPTGLNVSVEGQDLAFNWTAPKDVGSGVTGYKLYRSTTSGSYPSSPILTTTAITASYSNSSAIGKYYFQVRAYNDGGQSASSNEVNATIERAPGAPVALSASVEGSSVSLWWGTPTDIGSGIEGYRVYRTTTSGSYGTPFIVLSVNYTIDTDLAEGKYYYKVEAFNSVGIGPSSIEINVTIEEGAVITPTATLILIYTAPGNYTFTLISISNSEVLKSSVTIQVVPDVGVDNVSSWFGGGELLAVGDYFWVTSMQPGQTYTVTLVYGPTDGIMATSHVMVQAEESDLHVGDFLKYQLSVNITSEVHNITHEILGINSTTIFYKMTEEWGYNKSVNFYNESVDKTLFDIDLESMYEEMGLSFVGVESVFTNWGELNAEHYANATLGMDFWTYHNVLIKATVTNASYNILELLIDTNMTQITG